MFNCSFFQNLALYISLIKSDDGLFAYDKERFFVYIREKETEKK